MIEEFVDGSLIVSTLSVFERGDPSVRGEPQGATSCVVPPLLQVCAIPFELGGCFLDLGVPALQFGPLLVADEGPVLGRLPMALCGGLVRPGSIAVPLGRVPHIPKRTRRRTSPDRSADLDTYEITGQGQAALER